MVNQTADLDLVFRALADPGRRLMMERLSQGSASVSELGQAARDVPGRGRPARAGTGGQRPGPVAEVRPRTRTCSIDPAALRSAESWITERRSLWERRLDRLGEYLTDFIRRPAPPRPPTEENRDRRPEDGHHDPPSVTNATFIIEHRYPAHPAKVFGAWADGDAKGIWMDDEDYASDGTEYELDFRVGGHERFGGQDPAGVPYRYDAVTTTSCPITGSCTATRCTPGPNACRCP